MVVSNFGEVGLGEGSGVVGQARRFKAGQDTEGQIEGADDDLCR